MNAIIISNNYFSDKNAAIASNLFIKNAKPKKAELYAAIEAHNQSLEAAAVEVEVEAVTAEAEVEAVVVEAVVEVENVEPISELEQLKAEFNEAEQAYQFGFANGDLKAQKAASKRRAEAVKKIAAIKKKEVDAQIAVERKARRSKVQVEKPATTEGKTLEAYIAPGAVLKSPRPGSKAEAEVELLRTGATKEEMMQALGWSRWHFKFSAALNYGYGIRRNAEGRCFLVEPNDAAEVG